MPATSAPSAAAAPPGQRASGCARPASASRRWRGSTPRAASTSAAHPRGDGDLGAGRDRRQPRWPHRHSAARRQLGDSRPPAAAQPSPERSRGRTAGVNLVRRTLDRRDRSGVNEEVNRVRKRFTSGPPQARLDERGDERFMAGRRAREAPRKGDHDPGLGASRSRSRNASARRAGRSRRAGASRWSGSGPRPGSTTRERSVVGRFALVELDPGLDLLGELGRVAERDRNPISGDRHFLRQPLARLGTAVPTQRVGYANPISLEMPGLSGQPSLCTSQGRQRLAGGGRAGDPGADAARLAAEPADP